MKMKAKMNYRLVTTNQQGMVAIMVTIILMTIIGLVVIGFAKISQRDARQALDRQLSTQAYYAAETGVNDVGRKVAAALIARDGSFDFYNSKTYCGGGGAGTSPVNDLAPAGASSTLDTVYKIGYTCVKVDPRPTSIEYSPALKQGHSVIVRANTDAVIKEVTFSWQSPLGTNFDCPYPGGTPGSLPPITGAGAWDTDQCNAGLLRVDIIPTVGNLSRNALIDGSMTAFLYPNNTATTGRNAGSAANITGLGNQGAIIQSGCVGTDGTYACNARINVGSIRTGYVLRILPMYEDAFLSITATDGADKPQRIQNAQVVVDSTGKSQDVLRRIQVRLPINNFDPLSVPDYAIQATDGLCKVLISVRAPSVNGTVTSNAAEPICQSSLGRVP